MKTTKNDIATQIAEKTKLTKKDAKLFLNALDAVIIETLASGDQFCLQGIIKIEPFLRKATHKIHPKTKKDIIVDARWYPKAKFGTRLKKALQI